MKAGAAIPATLALWLLFLPAVHSTAGDVAHVDIVRDRFQQLLDQWGYHEWWSMWEQGTSRSRFTQRMDRSLWQLACCDKRLHNLQIAPVLPSHIVVSATLRNEQFLGLWDKIEAALAPAIGRATDRFRRASG